MLCVHVTDHVCAAAVCCGLGMDLRVRLREPPAAFGSTPA